MNVTMGGMLRAALVAGLFLAGCGAPQDGAGGGDCAEAKKVWGPSDANGRAYLGDACSAGSYGACDRTYSNCVEGLCQYLDSADGSVCTLSCSSSSQCGSWYCNSSGYCAPACQSHTYCDGYLCCTYAPSPSDPTVCYQVSCR